MYTIKDYINFYKDNSLEEVHWNAQDLLLAAIIVYLPIKSFEEAKSLKEFYDYAIYFKKDKSSGVMAPLSYELLELIKDSKRYKNLKISNFEKVRDNNTQFGAVTIRINDLTIISYKGTDGSLIGWMENFRLGYEYPTYTQVLAQKYLLKTLTKEDKKVYVTGHSKGGNLAMSSIMSASDDIYNRLVAVYNFDGPGFRKEEYKSPQYERLHKKLVNIIPTGSVVGTILNNKDYHVIKSTEYAFNEHYPTSWCCFGEHFIKGELSSISKQFHETTTTAYEKLDQEKVKETIETIFSNLPSDYSSDLKLNLNDFKEFYKNMRNIDPDVRNYLDTIIDSMIKSTYIKEKE